MNKTYSALCGILLVAVAFILGLSLLGYSPADSQQGNYFPVRSVSEIQNPCGSFGAWVSEEIYFLFGWGAYVFLFSLLAYSWMTFSRRAIDHHIFRAFGWWMGFIGMLICFALVFKDPYFSSLPFGPGGMLGSRLEEFLYEQLAFAGTFIIGVSLVLFGAIMCAENLLYALITFLVLAPARRMYRAWADVEFRLPAPVLVPAGAGAMKSGNKAKQNYAPNEAEPSCELRVASCEKDNGDLGGEERCEKRETQSENVVEAPLATRNSQLATEPISETTHSEEANSSLPTRNSQLATVEASMDKGDNKGWFWNRILPGSKTPKSEIELPEQKPEARDDEESLATRNSQLATDNSSLATRNSQLATQDELTQTLATAETAKAPYELPPIDLLKPPVPFDKAAYEEEILNNYIVLERTMADFKVKAKVVDHQTGPVLTMYEIKPERGIRLNKISCLTDDLSIAMKSGGGVRIVAPLPKKDTIGIEIPNLNKKSVRFREVLEESLPKTEGMNIPIYLGCDVAGSPIYADLAKLPHLLVAGQTGSGKSVCLHSIITSILMTRSPSQVRLLMIDPKMVELSQYKSIPHLMHPVVTDMKKAEALLAWAVDKMEERYTLLAKVGVRHVSQYNRMSMEERLKRIKPQSEEERQKIPETMPFIVIVADEMADMMMTCPKEVESHIARLAQKSRAVGIHLILATQKPTRDVITGLIKSNLPARISFKVTCLMDSRVVLDLMGAEKLLGAGDMLFMRDGPGSLVRGQGAFLDDEEIERLVRFVGKEDQVFEEDLIQYTEHADDDGTTGEADDDPSGKDELYDAAVEIVINEGRGSISLLQTRMSIGYGRAARLIEMMTNNRILSAHNGGKPREVLITPEDWELIQRQRQVEKERQAQSRREAVLSHTSTVSQPASDTPNLYASSSTVVVEPTEESCELRVASCEKSNDESRSEKREVRSENSQSDDSFAMEEDEENPSLATRNSQLATQDNASLATRNSQLATEDDDDSDELSDFFEESEFDDDDSRTNMTEQDLLDKISKASQAYLDRKK